MIAQEWLFVKVLKFWEFAAVELADYQYFRKWANREKKESSIIIPVWKKIIQGGFQRYHSVEYLPWCFIEKVHKILQSISENPNLDDVLKNMHYK